VRSEVSSWGIVGDYTPGSFGSKRIPGFRGPEPSRLN
jgi:hypothetical protein